MREDLPCSQVVPRKFLIQVASVAVVGFLFTTVMPDFALFNHGPRYNLANAFETGFDSSFLVTADEGFIAKAPLPTQKGDYSSVKGVTEYVVELGDTISAIAEKFGVSNQTVMINNGLYNADRLSIGEKLAILPVDGVLHKVTKGQDLAGVARVYGVKKELIAKQNGLDDDLLEAGVSIIVPKATRKVYTASSPSNNLMGTIANVKYVDTGKNLLFPTKGQYTQYFHRWHYAVDISNPEMPPIYAADNGRVVKSQCGWNGGYGCHVIVDHENGMVTLYAHLAHIADSAKLGSIVNRGQILGKMGRTGRVYGPTGIHLHFEVRVNGLKKNPIAYF